MTILAVVVGFAIASWSCGGSDLEAGGLRCEYRNNPLGLDTSAPRFSWLLHSGKRNDSQTAYRVLVGSSPAKLARGNPDFWDSGKVDSNQSIQVVYAGKSLQSGRRCWWTVRVWDSTGNPSKFSTPAWFEMGLLSPADWQAKWIQRQPQIPVTESQAFDDHPAPLFRREFTINRKIVRARVYVSGLGYCELRLNGSKVGDHVLDPGWTSYSKRVLYSVYDVTSHLKRGRNAAGIMLGNGWFNPLPLALWGHLKIGESLTTGEPRAIAQIVIDFDDGTSQIIASDESWRTSGGPILRNSVYLGEWYDARREQRGWDKPGFNDSGWEPAVLATEPELGPLRSESAPPIRVTRELRPVKLTEPKPGVFIFDFGQNFAGWSRLKVKGSAGTRVRLRYGELLYPDGTLNGMTSVAGQIKAGGKDYRYDGTGQAKTAFQMDEYILKGDGVETFTPRFTFHGFRYVELTGFPGTPDLNSLAGLRLNADVPETGSFACSNDMFNRIQSMVWWTELSNLFSVQSDCPHREKLGYGGDIVASSEMAMLNFDMARFYSKVATDFLDAARTNGGFTETAPFVGISDEGLGGDSGPVGWGTAEPLLLWQLRQYYGDQRLMSEQYEATRKWIGLLESKAVDGILDNGISDHESLVLKPRALTGTAFYYFNERLFARMARALGKDADAAAAESRADGIKSAFNQRFLQNGTGRYGAGSQACESFALYHGLVPVEEEPRALEVLTHDISGHDGHLTTGIFGTKYLLNTLTDFGRADLAYEVVNQTIFPGWGYMLQNGATTLWEHWAFSDDTYSHNHPMFGSVSEWFYKALAGIQPDPEAVGFDKILIKPQPVGDLKWVKASYDSVRGKIVSNWTREAGRFELQVQIPIGAKAIVFLPALKRDEIRENGKKIQPISGIQFLRTEEGKAVFAIGGGKYDFTSVIQ